MKNRAHDCPLLLYTYWLLATQRYHVLLPLARATRVSCSHSAVLTSATLQGTLTLDALSVPSAG